MNNMTKQMMQQSDTQTWNKISVLYGISILMSTSCYCADLNFIKEC